MKFTRASSKAISQAKAGQKMPPRLLLVAGWLMLALCFLDYSPVGICAAALAGSCDSTHEARVQLGEHGLQLVLHHPHGCIGHHHSVAAGILTIFARPAPAGSPDHVIQFGSADNFSSPTPMLPASLALAGPPLSALDEISIGVSNVALAVSAAPRPSPGECGRLICLRSTVFLI